MNDFKVGKLSSVFQTPAPSRSTVDESKNNWDGELVGKGFAQTAPTAKSGMNVTFDTTPKGLQFNDPTLSPQQMAKLLSDQLIGRLAKEKATERKSTRKKDYGLLDGLSDGLSDLLDNDDGVSSLLKNAKPEDIQEFLEFFQSEIERHLAGLTFQNIYYDYELMAEMMQRYGYYAPQ